MQAQRLDEKLHVLHKLKEEAHASTLARFNEILHVSWIYHDSALEGVVYDMGELKSALGNEVASDASVIAIYDEIKQNMAAIEFLEEFAEGKPGEVTLDTIKKIYAILAPEEIEGRSPPKYRKEMPNQRKYFHEISQPEKISYKMRQLVQWINSPETRRATHTIRLAAKAHYQLLHIYPFPKQSGKVARLLMNYILMQGGYPPAIIHATERQLYYDALKTSDNRCAQMVTEGLVQSMDSAVRYFRTEAAARKGRRVRTA